MIRRSLAAGAIIIMTTVACGGGGGSPTPTPTPTPTPSPTASPAAFPLPTAREFAAVGGTLAYSGDASGTITLGAVALDAFADRVRLALQPTATTTSTAETVVRELTEESRFTGADLSVAPAAGVTEYRFVESSAPSTAGAFTQLSLLNNSVSGSVTSDAALSLTFVSYAGWFRGESTSGTKRVTYATFGTPTLATDMPTTGTAAYTMRVAGRAAIANSPGPSATPTLGGTVTTSINYATGVVTVTIALTRDSGIAYATVTGTGSITSGTNRFTGNLSGGAATGTFQGLAYGNAAGELGISFVLSGVTVGTASSTAVGVLVGRRS